MSAIDVAENPPSTKISAKPKTISWPRPANQSTVWSGLSHGWLGGWVRVRMKKTTV